MKGSCIPASMFPSKNGISCLLFDLDNTIYPASSGLGTTMDLRMSQFVSNLLGLSLEEGARLRHQGYERYGTTLRWLQVEQGLTDSHAFMEAVHPADVMNHLAPDPALRVLLDSIPLEKAILTNSPRAHADRILSYLEISDCFAGIHDLVSNGYVGKPHASAYETALGALGWQVDKVLFLDDVPAYLEGFRKLGGHCLLVDEAGKYPNANFPRIRTIHELPGYLAQAS